MLDYAQHCPFGAMTAQSHGAEFASPAGEIDLTRDSFSNERGAAGLDNLPNKLMPWDAGKAVVATLQLKVGVADPGRQHANQRKTGRPRGRGYLPD